MAFQDWVFAHFSTEAVLSAVLLLGLGLQIAAGYLVRDIAEASASVTGGHVDWRRGLLLLPIAFVAYWNPFVAFMLLPVVLLRCAYLIDRLWVMRNIGPERYITLLREATLASSQPIAQAFIWGSAAATTLAGGVLWLFSDGPQSWSHWFALGIVVYGILSGFQRARRLRQLLPARLSAGAGPPIGS